MWQEADIISIGIGRTQ